MLFECGGRPIEYVGAFCGNRQGAFSRSSQTWRHFAVGAGCDFAAAQHLQNVRAKLMSARKLAAEAELMAQVVKR